MSNPIIRYVQKQLFGQKGMIANNKAVNFEAAKLAEKLSEFGFDPRLIQNEKQLEGIINQIKELQKKRMAESMEVISQDDPRFKGIMSKMTGSNVIKRDFGKPFKEEVKKMKSDEEIVSNIKKSNERSVQNLRMQMMDDKVANDMFQGGPSRDPKTDADMLAEFIAEDAGKIYDDLPTKESLKFYDRAYNAIVRYRKKDPEEKADGGRIGYFLGSSPKILKGQSLLRALLNYFGKETGKAKPSDFLRLTNPKSFNKLFEAAQGKMSKEGIMGTDMVKDYQTQMRGERIKSIKDMLESGKNIKRSQDRITSYKNEVKQKFMDDLGLSEEEAEVAATRLSTLAENIVTKEGSRKLPNITEEGILQLENIIKNMETGGKKARELNAYGGRIGYKLGGIDKGRRAFLAALGAGAAGIGAAKTGILKFLGKGKKASKALEVTTPNAPGKPEWFDALVNKVIKEGNDVSKNFATKEREIVHVKALDDETTIYVHRDLDTGTVRVDIDDPIRNVQGDQGDALVSLEVKPGIADEGTRGRPPDEFVAVENDYANYMDGPDDFTTEVVDNTVTNTKNLTSDLTKVKLYAKDQKKPTIKEIVESRKRQEALKQAEENPSQYAADRYTGPEPDTDYIDDNFASGGIARMLGE